jgi:probable HAF family extracellular repeat protein
LLSSSSAQAASFQIVGEVPSNTAIAAENVSPDGGVVVGEASSGLSFRWTPGSGNQVITSGSQALASGASGDGSVIVGARDLIAYRWQAGVRTDLAPLAGDSVSLALDISADGSTIVGLSSGTEDHAFVHQGGSMSSLGDLPGGAVESRAESVSADGSVIVGQGASALGNEAFRWEGGVMQGLGDLAGGTFASSALDVTLDGSVVVGWGTNAGGIEAFRWENGVMAGLGHLRGDTRAYGVSADGSIIVGTAGSAAMIWDPANGMRDLKTVLQQSFGLVLDDIVLTSALGISSDGRTIVGSGIHSVSDGILTQDYQIAWVATIPEPSTLPLLAVGLAALAVTRRRR